MKFFTSDWRADPRLKMCSAGARGVWIEMICLMHEAKPYGHLLVYGQPPNEAQLASLTGIPFAELHQYLADLERMGVFSRTKEGVIYSRKLVRMEAKSAKARKNGKKGGNPSLGNKTENCESLNLMDKAEDKPQKPEARSQILSKDTNVSLSVPAEPTHANDSTRAVSAFNEAASRSGWSQVQKLTPQRSKQIRARLAECGGIDGWQVALRKAQDSDFLCGRTSKPWTGFGIDWFTKQANFTKLMEGNYDNRDRKADQIRSADDPVLRAIARAASSF